MRGRQFSAQSGFNLIEMAIVLAIVGLVLAGIWTAAGMYSASSRMNETIKGLTSTVGKVRTLIGSYEIDNIAAGQGTLGIDVTTQMLPANIFPTDWVSQGVVKTPEENTVQLLVQNMAPPIFGFYINSLTPVSCTNLVVRLSSLSAAADKSNSATQGRSMLRYLRVVESNYSTSVFPIDIATANTACVAASNTLWIAFNVTR